MLEILAAYDITWKCEIVKPYYANLYTQLIKNETGL